ncbi:helix-turn-helix domain-containing protein [Hyalangium versicolor]|uniref:helix-turn-helix domain-containing protein n=1 Tax=Hyalangium versicolor TaxID=2861190 RepID=UPI001CCEE36F|nr:helix-turn-helix domain-containing protein [Hyalangium versicolor]
MSTSSIQLAPRHTLSRFVQGLRIVTRGAGADPYVKLPDGQVDLIVRIRDTGSEVHTMGTRLRVFRKLAEEVPQAIAVRFKPGRAYPFFGVPMSELTNRILPIETLWGADGAQLCERVAETSDNTERLRLLEDALSERLCRGDVFEPASAYVVRRAIRAITDAVELPRVSVLARGLGVSERQLRRAFDEVVGVGPKEFVRVVRFQRALRASARVATPDWGAIAAAVGYYDQAHLITEFRGLTGVTPGALLRARLHQAPVMDGALIASSP